MEVIAKEDIMGLLKTLLRELPRNPWIPMGEKVPEPPPEARAPEPLPQKLLNFCDAASKKPCITVCQPRGDCECDCRSVREALVEGIARLRLNVVVGDAKAGCPGKCQAGPFLGFPQKGFFYLGVRARDVPDILYETIVHGRILFDYLSVNPERAYREDIYYEKETGFLAAIDSQVCMVQVAKSFLDFEKGLSCGKCVPCRIGMQQMEERMDKIVEGEGTLEDLEHIRALCHAMISLPNCEFAMTSSRPVLSAVTSFEDEFLAHIEGHQCPAGVCKALVEYQRKQAVRKRHKR
jgi:(2Fe-2S) ferredoxin